MTNPSILVLGATGSVGGRVVTRLRAAGHRVRAASRNGDVRFDWNDPSTFTTAIGDATTMFLMAPDGVPIDPAFVATAVGSGVRRIVLLSSKAIEPMGDERLLAAERTVRESGAAWTIVRASWFAQNFDEGFFAEAVRAGEIAMPLADVRQAFIDAGDIAAVVAASLVEDGHEGQVYEITGPRSLSFGEAAEIIGRTIGRPVRYRGTAEEFVAAQVSIGLSEEEAHGAVRAFEALRALGDEQPSDLVRRITGQRPKSFENYATDAAATGIWGRSE